MNRRALIVIAGAALGAAPAGGAAGRHVQTEEDPYTHVKRVWLQVPTHVCASATANNEPRADVRLVMNSYRTPDGSVTYAVGVDIQDDHLM